MTSPCCQVRILDIICIEQQTIQFTGEGVYNMVVEVPRWSNAKIEIDTKSALNPLKQDMKHNGKFELAPERAALG